MFLLFVSLNLPSKTIENFYEITSTKELDTTATPVESPGRNLTEPELEHQASSQKSADKVLLEKRAKEVNYGSASTKEVTGNTPASEASTKAKITFNKTTYTIDFCFGLALLFSTFALIPYFWISCSFRTPFKSVS